MSLKRIKPLFLLVPVLQFAVLAGCTSKDALLTGELPPAHIPAAPVSSPASAPVQDVETFRPGDMVELYVKEDSTLNNNYEVREGGYILIPRVGRIPVAGLNRTAAEGKIKEALQKSQLAEATVLIERNSRRQPGAGDSASGGSALPAGTTKIMIYVTGSVQRAGPHSVPLPKGRALGAYEAILSCGGMGRLAQDQRVEILRADSTGRRHRAVVDLSLVRQGLAEDPPVGEGDIIHVPEKVFGF